ncbi:hypothetical protein BOX15_Mlig024027g2 [Macrostomum lignano]|uniref:Uncharacterized protein n=1 Tax=Macrostomum lignano TaxID=282301 RepID=A0A267EIC1_9PLAT|nr:hypothetical protein BOX15_Mlig024027g2 [Macrostomum lignano]
MTVKKNRIRLKRPVRLAWSCERRIVFVVDQAGQNRYGLAAFSVQQQFVPNMLQQCAVLPDQLLSLSTPCVLASAEGIWISLLTSEGPKILCLSSDCLSIVRVVRLSLAGAVRDMCWLPDNRLGICSDGALWTVDSGSCSLHPEKKLRDSNDPRYAKSTANASAVSAAYLSGQCYMLEQPTQAVRVYDSFGNQLGELAVTDPTSGETISNLRPHCVRASQKLQLVIVLDRAACSVHVCRPDGGLYFSVGPQFNDAFSLLTPEDAVAADSILLICSPEFALYLVSLKRPATWRTVVTKRRCGLACPVRLAWLASRQWLVVADQLPDRVFYRIQPFSISSNEKAATLFKQCLPVVIESLTRPSLLCGRDCILAACSRPNNSNIIVLIAAGAHQLVQQFSDGEATADSLAVTDLFWWDQRLAGCHGNRLLLWPDVHYESYSDASCQPYVESAAFLSPDRGFVLELPSGSVQLSKSLGHLSADKLRLTQSGQAKFVPQPARVRVCSERGLLILLDPSAEAVHVCDSEGGLWFSVGPRFGTDSSLSKPSDAISTGELLAICSPDRGLFLVSLEQPSQWRTTIKKERNKLRRPIRLAWSSSRQLLIVLDEVSTDRFSMSTFQIVKSPTAATLHLQAALRDPVRSLAVPSVLSSSGGFLLSALTEEGPRLLSVADDCSAVSTVADCQLPADGGAVTDMSWLKGELWLCCGGKLIKPDLAPSLSSITSTSSVQPDGPVISSV